MWLEAGLEEPGANLNAGAAAVVAVLRPRSTTSRPAASSRASGGSQLAQSVFGGSFGMDSARTKTHGRATVACQRERWYVSHF